MEDTETAIRPISALVQDLFEIGAVFRQGNHLVFSLFFRYERDRSLRLLKDRLETAGYEYKLREGDSELLLSIDPTPQMRVPWLNVLFFVLTLLTVYFVPVFLRYGALAEGSGGMFRRTFEALGAGAGLEFTVALMSILFVHEMGHFIASRRRNIVTSWPYFIPAPNLFGTFGAIIKSKSPFWNRRDLIEVGAAGPVFGWFVAVFWLCYGLLQSDVVAVSAFDNAYIPISMTGESILVRLLAPAILGPAQPGYIYSFSEAAFAGWVGLLVTAINMLPIGQLDGGHVLYGLIRRRQHVLGKLATAGLIVFGFQSAVWWLFAGFGLYFGMSHPPTLDDSRPPSRVAKTMGFAALVILVISFAPAPFGSG